MIRVSIIMPVYKVEKYIERCLQSVMSQTYGEIECIVVNDCTPDQSFAKARAFVARHGKDNESICFLFAGHDKNKGLSEARNTGVRMATGDYVYFLDSDDAITPTAIADLVATAEANDMPDVVYGHTKAIDNNGKEHLFETDAQLHSMHDNKSILLGNLYDRWPRIACNKLVRRSLFTEHGFWFASGLLHEDELWTFEIATVITSMICCHKTTYIYYVGDPNSITRSGSQREKHFTDNFTILERKLSYIPKVSCPRDVAENVYNLCYMFYYSIVLLHFPKRFRRECRKRLGKIIRRAKASGSWRLTTRWYARMVWMVVR